MQPISKPLTLVAQAVTGTLCNEEKISEGGPVKSLVLKLHLKLLGEEEDQKKIPQ